MQISAVFQIIDNLGHTSEIKLSELIKLTVH